MIIVRVGICYLYNLDFRFNNEKNRYINIWMKLGVCQGEYYPTHMQDILPVLQENWFIAVVVFGDSLIAK